MPVCSYETFQASPRAFECTLLHLTTMLRQLQCDAHAAHPRNCTPRRHEHEAAACVTWLQDLRARESQPSIRQDACQHVQTGIPSQDTASLDRLFSSEETTCSELTEAAACLCAVHLEASTCSRQTRIYRTYSNSSASPCGCASQKASKQQACRYAIAGSAKEVVLLKTRTAQSMTNRQGKLEMRAKVPQRLHTIRVTLYIRWS